MIPEAPARALRSPEANWAPYSAAGWERERAARTRLPCPDCGSSVDYGPRGKRTGCRYRACKICGFWQELGGDPYRCRLTGHQCLGEILEGKWCPTCTIISGPLSFHTCFLILTDDEVERGDYACQVCHVVLTGRHVIPWGIESPRHLPGGP